MKRLYAALAIPLLLGMATYGVNWRLEHPPWSEADEWLKRQTDSANSLEMVMYDNSASQVPYGKGIAIRNRRLIQQVLSTLRCASKFSTRNKKVTNNDLIVDITLNGNEMQRMGIYRNGGEYYLRCTKIASVQGPLRFKVIGETALNPRFIPRFYRVVNSLLPKSAEKDSPVLLYDLSFY